MIGLSDAAQLALIGAMSADAGLAALVGGRIYDDIPENAPAPYISLGPESWEPMGGGCLDGAEGSVQIDIWSDAVGRALCKDITERVVALFDGPEAPVVSGGGYRITVCEVVLVQIQRDNQARLRHGIVQLQLTVERDDAA